jgi:prephenate dehydrogenase
MKNISVTIIGLGRVGTSVGLALKRYNSQPDAQHQFEIYGVESRPDMLRDAESAGAIDKSVRNLHDAVQNRDIVVLAQPYAEVRPSFQAIGESARVGTVVLDASPLKLPSLEWAKQYFKDGVHLVGIQPIINPNYLFDSLDEARHAKVDLFDKGSILLMPAANCIPEAIELAADFATLLGARTHYFDAAEHDSLAAASDTLPTLIGVTLFDALSRIPGWGDIQRITNPRFGRLTHMLFDTHPDDLRDEWMRNRESLLRYTDILLDELHEVRKALASNNQDGVEALLTRSSEQYSQWINRRHNNTWDEDLKTPSASAGSSILSNLMGGFVANRLTGGDKKKKGD